MARGPFFLPFFLDFLGLVLHREYSLLPHSSPKRAFFQAQTDFLGNETPREPK